MWKDFYKRLNLEPKLEEERAKFTARIRNVLNDLDNEIEPSKYIRWNNYDHYPIYSKVAFVLGKSKEDSLTNYLHSDLSFEDTLKVVEAVLQVLIEEWKTNKTELQKRRMETFNHKIEEAINLSALDLGIMFVNGKFYPKGAEELDKILIEDNLEWLKDYPKVKEPFENALKHLLNKNYKDAITNAHSSLESLTKTFLRLDTRLDKKETRASLIQRVGLNEEWGRILHDFSEIAHEYSSRHGRKDNIIDQKEDSSAITYELAEFYIYLTGTFIRLISKKNR